MKQYVIIGNGVASVGCIEGIRSKDSKSKIIVISKEPYKAYCRPLISYYLEGKTTLEKMDYRPEDFYERMNCDVRVNQTVKSIDEKKKEVILENGEVISYDSLCIATGSKPFIPPMEGLENVSRKFTFMTLEDTLELEKELTSEANVLIIGAGLIGLKCAEGILKRVKSVTVCDLSNRILSSILDEETASLMQTHLEKNGISFMLENSVASFGENHATMKNGEEVDFDIVVLAVGVQANTKLIQQIGGKINRGILVDKQMKTSVKDMYAAGDCTEGKDISLGEKRVLALLPNAYMQGHTAGVSMALGKEVFDKAIPMNSIGFFGLHIMTAGTYVGDVFETKTETMVRKLFVKDGVLKGFLLMGETNQAGILTALIREKTPLASIDFELLKQKTTTAIFSSDARVRKFGGVV